MFTDLYMINNFILTIFLVHRFFLFIRRIIPGAIRNNNDQRQRQFRRPRRPDIEQSNLDTI